MKFIGEFRTVGEAWLAVGREILTCGLEHDTGDEHYKECKGISVNLKYTQDKDAIFERHCVKEKFDWMQNNFEVIGTVPELGNANSYAERLYCYLGKKNQVEWVINRINAHRNVRSATITTFEPLSDTTYVPCVSLFDFDVVGDFLDLYVYARALDFGSKAPYNLVCIIGILEKVAKGTGLQCGTIHLVCKSAHIFDIDYKKMESVVGEMNSNNEQ